MNVNVPDGQRDIPNANGRNAHADSTSLQRPHLSRVDPRHRGECKGVDNDQQVAERNDGVGFRAMKLDGDIRVAADATRNVLPSGQEPTNDVMASSHRKSTVEQKWPAASPIDVEEHDSGKNLQRVI